MPTERPSAAPLATTDSTTSPARPAKPNPASPHLRDLVESALDRRGFLHVSIAGSCAALMSGVRPAAAEARSEEDLSPCPGALKPAGGPRARAAPIGSSRGLAWQMAQAVGFGGPDGTLAVRGAVARFLASGVPIPPLSLQV